ncbi:MAG: citrate lyase acyl carrier protein [Negativicutes bacterium]|nr:citrate lyase acyl carrier protein [Negativicutes bacterium]
MAKLVKAAQAGFDEKNDALVTVEPIASGIELELTSKVMRQYGEQIKELILNTVKESGFDGVKLTVADKNAWDYTIKARVLGALERGSKA